MSDPISRAEDALRMASTWIGRERHPTWCWSQVYKESANVCTCGRTAVLGHLRTVFDEMAAERGVRPFEDEDDE